MNLMFDVIIGITMLLCFFALSANMSSNLFQQTKEVAVMRMLGLTKIRVKLLYFYEAVILVFASCLLGIMIGILIGYTMTLQQVLIMHVDLQFYFPWEQFFVIFALSFLCSFLSTFGPTTELLRNTIA